MKIRRFETGLADLHSKLQKEAGKTRPVLVVQNDPLNQIDPSSIICPITSKARHDISMPRVNLNKDMTEVKSKSAIMID